MDNPNLVSSQASRVEFQLHDWVAPVPVTDVWVLNGLGVTADLLTSNSAAALRFTDSRDGYIICGLTLSGYHNVLVRVQRDPANMRFVCEVWDENGGRYQKDVATISSLGSWPYSGGRIGDYATTTDLGFLRVFDTIVADGSAPPVLSAGGNLLDLEFENNLTDSSSHNYTYTFPSPTYADTPASGQSVVITPGQRFTSIENPSTASDQPWRVEFQMHDWTVTGQSDVWDLNGIGAYAQLLTYGGHTGVLFADKRDVTSGSVCGMQLDGRTNVVVRVQRDPANLKFVCELWNYDGTGYARDSLAITSINTGWMYTGGAFGDYCLNSSSPCNSGTSVSLGFFRIFDTLVDEGSARPVTTPPHIQLDLEFENNVLDTSGKGNSVVFPGTPTYATTPNIPSPGTGKSLVLTSGVTSTSVDSPHVDASQPWRVEFQMHDWTVTGQSKVWDLNGIGAYAELLTYGGHTGVQFTDKRDTASGSVCGLQLDGRANVVVRVQRDPANLRFVCELWNYDGTGYAQGALAITSINTGWTYTGGGFGDSGTSVSLGFFRIYDSILPDASALPDPLKATRTLLDLALDGDTVDTSGYGRAVTFSGATYSGTPNMGSYAVIKSDGAPSYLPQASLRAGQPATLDGTDSISMSSAGTGVTYQWDVTSQPEGTPALLWSDKTSPKPVVTGLVFGTYRFTLTVKGPDGNSSSPAYLDIGAVATDNNGVVVQANPDADKLFGPMIALGKNPWRYQDYIALHSATVRSSYIQAVSPPTWAADLPGTIAFSPFYASMPNKTTVNTSFGASDTTIVLTDATKLDFSTLPAVIQVGPLFGYIEEVRICSVAGNALTVCFDGRGWRQGLYNEVSAPQAWAAGTTVTQIRTAGTGTTFLTDFCPAGPGEEGQISYGAGTVGVTAGSPSVTGASTAWTDSTLVGQRMRIAGHHGGVSFVFFATVQSINSPTSITLSRNYPAGADTESGISYAIIQPRRQIARDWLRTDGSTGRQVSQVSACESDTNMYMAGYDSIANDNTAAQTGQHYSWSDTTWMSEFGPNYYDEVLAHYAGYYRSGLNLFRDNARGIGDYWATMPELDQGYAGPIPRRAGVTGMVAGAVLDGRGDSNWPLIRKMANTAITAEYSGGAILSGCDTDVREDAYGLSWLALAAMFDPVDAGNDTTPNQRSYWKAQLASAYSRDAGCLAGNTFPQPFYTGTDGVISMTNGSTTATGTSIPSSLCAVTATGTLAVNNGSTSVSGSGFVSGAKIVIKALRSGTPVLFYSKFTLNSTSSITLATPFDGDTGAAYSYQIESDENFLSFATGPSDHTNLNTFYGCQWVSATQITLDRAWAGATGAFNATRQPSTYVGYGATPFQNGIKVLAMKYASLGATSTTASNYASMANTVATWILSTGFDPSTKGLYYARGFYNCEPPGANKIGCDYDGSSPSSSVASRTLSGEAQNAMTLAYLADPTSTNKTFGDQFYGAQWGKPGYQASSGYYSDNIYIDTLDSDNTFQYKWIGFLFGIGMSHQWPAARLGGVAAEDPQSRSVTFTTSTAAPGAQIAIIAPSSKTAAVTCSTSPCSITIDKRQGSHWYQVTHLDGSGQPVLDGSGHPVRDAWVLLDPQ